MMTITETGNRQSVHITNLRIRMGQQRRLDRALLTFEFLGGTFNYYRVTDDTFGSNYHGVIITGPHAAVAQFRATIRH